MKNNAKSISNPEDLNKHLKYTSPVTWIILGLVICLLAGFFAWACVYKMKVKISGLANVQSGEVSLVVSDSSKSKLAVGQKVYILEQIGEIVSFSDEKPVVSGFDLQDGEYTYTVVLKEIKPIEFLIK